VDPWSVRELMGIAEEMYPEFKKTLSGSLRPITAITGTDFRWTLIQSRVGDQPLSSQHATHAAARGTDPESRSIVRCRCRSVPPRCRSYTPAGFSLQDARILAAGVTQSSPADGLSTWRAPTSGEKSIS